MRSPSLGRRVSDRPRADRWALAPGPRILLAEDDAEMRDLLASTLRRRGYSVLEAPDGNDAVERLARLWESDPRAAPDLLIADVRMPIFSGLDILSAVHLMNWKLPVVLITAFGDPGLHREAGLLGVVTVLDKPFDIEDLIETVQRIAPVR